MYQTIIIECQTLNGETCCEDCIASKECHLKKALERQRKRSEQVEFEVFPVQCH